jgi:hypothetical protein
MYRSLCRQFNYSEPNSIFPPAAPSFLIQIHSSNFYIIYIQTGTRCSSSTQKTYINSLWNNGPPQVTYKCIFWKENNYTREQIFFYNRIFIQNYECTRVSITVHNYFFKTRTWHSSRTTPQQKSAAYACATSCDFDLKKRKQEIMQSCGPYKQNWKAVDVLMMIRMDKWN